MASWPADLPQYVQQDGYNEMLPDPTVRTGVDAGPPKVRKRWSAVVKKFTVRMWMNAAQITSFEEFFTETLSYGSVSFDWVHPRTQADVACRIVGGTVNISPSGPNFIVGFDLEVLPTTASNSTSPHEISCFLQSLIFG